MEKLDYQPVEIPSDSRSSSELKFKHCGQFQRKTSQNLKKAVYNSWLSTCWHGTSLIHCHLMTFKTVNTINRERDRYLTPQLRFTVVHDLKTIFATMCSLGWIMESLILE